MSDSKDPTDQSAGHGSPAPEPAKGVAYDRQELQGCVMLRVGLVEERIQDMAKAGDRTSARVLSESLRQSDRLFQVIVSAGIEALMKGGDK